MSQAKLFVVDDDDAARTLLAEALLKEGYEVEAFSSGQAAVERGKQSCRGRGSDRHSDGAR